MQKYFIVSFVLGVLGLMFSLLTQGTFISVIWMKDMLVIISFIIAIVSIVYVVRSWKASETAKVGSVVVLLLDIIVLLFDLILLSLLFIQGEVFF